VRLRLAFGGLFLLILATRLCHLDILWVEECYPGAAALQVLAGKIPYRDFWFDKPPLSILAYLLWGARAGWPLRLAGALFVTLLCWLLYRFAVRQWGNREALLAAGLGAFFLTFGIPSAVMALAPDLLLTAPHVAAVYLIWRRRPFWSGFWAGVGMLVNTKAIFVLLVCLLWRFRSAPRVAAGFLVPNAVAVAWLAGVGALRPYYEQVWRWGWLYSRDSFIANPVWEGIRRTLNWAGFHATLAAGAAWYWWRERNPDSRRFALWALISLAAVAAGARFFPRYYFQLLPVMILAGARGLVLLGPRRAAVAMALLLVPLARFGPRYAILAQDLVTSRHHRWRDLAMYQGSRQAAELIQRRARPGDSLLVWGYRPDIFVLTRLPAGTPFLDSQPLTGVIADRHLTLARPSAPALARRNRRALVHTRPSFIVDGLGPYNPRLAVTSYADLAGWLSRYREIARIPTAVIYQLRSTPVPGERHAEGGRP